MANHMADLHYYYFKSSTRGKEILLEFLKFLNMEWESHGKYVTAGWLLLENCVEKQFKNYSALKLMFLGRNPDNARVNDGRQEEGHTNKSYKARDKKENFS